MRNRGAERRLAPRPFRIDVNPLMVARRRSKAVHARRIDCQPLADERLAAHQRAQCLSIEPCHVALHAAAPGWRKPNSAFERTVITVSPCWLMPAHSVETMPRSGLLDDTRLS